MGYLIEVNSDNYEFEVVEKSYEKPVLVDFFATWCGPCKVLKPILEKLVEEYDFVLAAVDIDRNPELANRFGVEGVPDVRIVTKGDMIPGFVGVLSEAQLRDLMTRLNLKSDLDERLKEIEQTIALKNNQQAKQLFDQLFQKYPNHPHVAIAAAKFLIGLNRMEEAKKILATIPPDNKEDSPPARALESLIELQQTLDTQAGELEQSFAKGINFALAGEYKQALPILLSIIERNRTFRNDGARKAMLALFNLLGNDHPLTKEYRAQLMLVLW